MTAEEMGSPVGIFALEPFGTLKRHLGAACEMPILVLPRTQAGLESFRLRRGHKLDRVIEEGRAQAAW
jgi:hypothetical protein